MKTVSPLFTDNFNNLKITLSNNFKITLSNNSKITLSNNSKIALPKNSKVTHVERNEVLIDDAKIVQTFNTFFSNIVYTLNIDRNKNIL